MYSREHPHSTNQGLSTAVNCDDKLPLCAQSQLKKLNVYVEAIICEKCFEGYSETSTKNTFLKNYNIL